MTQLRTVIGGSILFSLLLAAAVPFLSDTGQTDVLGVAIVTVWALSVVATCYLWFLVITDPVRPRSWLMAFMAITATQITVAFGPIVYVVVTPYLHLVPVAVGWGRLLVGMALFTALAVPIEKALLFLLVQRDHNIQIVKSRNDALTRIEVAIAENTDVSRAGVDAAERGVEAAERAYTEANSVNAKIAAQGDRLTGEIEGRQRDRVTDAETAASVKETGEDTNERVTDIQDRVPGGAK